MDAGGGAKADSSGKPAASAKADELPGVKPGDAPKPDDKLAPKFLALARQEGAIRTDREKLEVERKTFEDTRKAETAKYAGYETLRKTALDNPLEALRLLRGDPDTQTSLKAAIRAGAGAKKETEADRIDRLEKERAADKKNAADEKERLEKEQRDARRTAAESKKQAEIAKLVAEKPDEFELLTIQEKAKPGIAAKLVYRVMEKHFAATYLESTGTGEILSVEDAVKKCEDGLLASATLLTGAKKLQAKPADPAPDPAPAAGQSGTPRKAAPKAPDAGQVKQTTTEAPPDPGRKKTREEEVDEVIARHSKPRAPRAGKTA